MHRRARVAIVLSALTATFSLTLPAHCAAAESEKRFTERQRVGYLGKANRETMSRDVLTRLRDSREIRPVHGTHDRVLAWHEILLDSVALDHTPDPDTGEVDFLQGGPTRTGRALAMVQIAVFDALNAFDGRYGAYHHVGRAARADASIDVAIAHASHAVQIALYPAQRERLDALLASDVARSRADPARRARGRAVGIAAARAMLEARASDNSFDFEPDYGEGGRVADGVQTWYGTGVNSEQTHDMRWKPDPLTPGFAFDFGLALGGYWGRVTPFFLPSGDRFRVAEPPMPGSVAYRNGHAFTRLWGASPDVAGSRSTPVTRFTGNFWGYDATPLLGVPPRLYNQIAVQVATNEGLDDALELARYLAMVNGALADAGIAAWDSKYYYDYARPVTGIRADDGDPTTPDDPHWRPVGVSVINTVEPITPTPPFPSYPSGHATFGAAVFEVMRGFFGNDTPFTFVSDEYDGRGTDPLGAERPLVPVRFQSLQQAQELNGISRVFNGVHWPWDNTAGQTLGVNVGRHVREQAAFQPADG